MWHGHIAYINKLCLIYNLRYFFQLNVTHKKRKKEKKEKNIQDVLYVYYIHLIADLAYGHMDGFTDWLTQEKEGKYL